MGAAAVPGPHTEHRLSRLWAASALSLTGAAALSWWFGDLLLHGPDDQVEANAMAALSMFMISIGCLGTSLIVVETLVLIRFHERRTMARSVAFEGPPGWFLDPWAQASSRWWNGSNWTARLR